jgi:DHA1 family bicyclomycin/chloramphenicol resistance-like MFS transporter
VAGVIAPLVMHSAIALALTAFAFLAAGTVSWIVVRRHWPSIGQPEVE